MHRSTEHTARHKEVSTNAVHCYSHSELCAGSGQSPAEVPRWRRTNPHPQPGAQTHVKCDKTTRVCREGVSECRLAFGSLSSQECTVWREETPRTEILEDPLEASGEQEELLVWDRESWKGIHGFDTWPGTVLATSTDAAPFHGKIDRDQGG